jgi:alkanesulfonate monooxygenase SsuD/methylene tetrahydromethanopterin reductase-like flavin-dependent oxidoreductase (luciferase family)
MSDDLARHPPAGTVRVGLLLPTGETARPGRDVGSLLDLAIAAEALGVDSLWVGDSLFARPRLDALSLLGALAAATTTIQLGTAVLIAPMWNPLLLARAVATLDQLSAGRLVLGIGAGPSYGPAKKEFAALGIPFQGRLTRLLEIADTCRRLWADGPAAVDGQLWSFRNVDMLPKPVQAGGPALWLGGSGPRTLAAAGRHFDGWLPVVTSTTAFAAELTDVRAAAVGAGRDPEAVRAGAYVTLAVDANEARAGNALRTSLESYYGAPWDRIRDLQDYYAGPAEGALEWLHRYVAAGAEHLVIRFAGADVLGQFEALSPYLGALSGAVDPRPASAQGHV